MTKEEYQKCRRKILYTSKSAANENLTELLIREYRPGERNESRMRIYRCQWCGGYHIGKITPKKGKGRKK